VNSPHTNQHGQTLYRAVAILIGAIVASSSFCIAQNRKNLPPQRPAQVQQPAPVQRPAPRQAPVQQQAPTQRPPVTAPNVHTNPYANHPVTPSHGNNPGSLSSAPGNNNSHANSSAFGATSRVRPESTVSLKSGGMAKLNPNGQLHSIDRNGTHVEYGAHGVRTTVGTRNGARVVTVGAHQGGYVQSAYAARNGHIYVGRTYVQNNVVRTVAYRSYYYRGAVYYGFAPTHYYRPAYYSWAYTPWGRPVYWSWGWTPAAYPWYGYYGYYFSPYPAYGSAAFWLTDYLISQDLQAAYAARAQTAPNAFAPNAPNAPNAPDAYASGTSAAQPDYSQAPSAQQPAGLSPETKQAIAEAVTAQLVANRAAAATQPQGANGATSTVPAQNNDVPPALDPASRTFVVASSLDVVSNDQECTLTPGDVITRVTDAPDQNQKVAANVLSSKRADCAAGKQIAVSVEDLQEMQNHFREQLDSGLKELASRQGTSGLPKAPDTTLIAGEVPPPVADATAAQAVQDQEATADQAERDATKETSGQGAL
jgi:hypothetical protein